MRYVCKNPPWGGGERNPYQLIDYMFLLALIPNIWIYGYHY